LQATGRTRAGPPEKAAVSVGRIGRWRAVGRQLRQKVCFFSV
jgi:hypothetical protein